MASSARLLLGLLLAASVGATEAPVPPEPLGSCTLCHGADLQGNVLVDAPGLAGLPSWYLSRQLEAFRKGWRGYHAEDFTGMEMRAQALVMTEERLREVPELLAALPAGAPAATLETGDVERGRRLYTGCVACHGATGRGNPALYAPPLVGREDWYLLRQLQGFKSGARGGARGDIQGAVMRASTARLTDEQALLDLLAYLASLRSD